MVEVNDLAFRILCRRHGVSLCYTGMINAHMWTVNPHTRSALFRTLPTDRPLIIQLNGSDEDELIGAAISLSVHADAIDLNFGCTQKVAKRGRFGFFMVNTAGKRECALAIVRRLVANLAVPLTAKIRLLSGEDGAPDARLTADFARRLEECGVSLIAVHGRHQQLDKAGDVNAGAIREIVNAVSIPVLANGGVQSAADADELIAASGAAGVMVGHGLLSNPAMFDTAAPALGAVATGREYLAIFREVGGDEIVAKRHLFLLFESVIREHPELAAKLKERHSVEELSAFLDEFEAAECPDCDKSQE
jgi:tRNA-dihydrouridine synthase 1